MQVVLLVAIVLSIHNNTIIPMSIIMLSSFLRSTLAYIVYGQMSLDGKFLTKVDVKLQSHIARMGVFDCRKPIPSFNNTKGGLMPQASPSHSSTLFLVQAFGSKTTLVVFDLLVQSFNILMFYLVYKQQIYVFFVVILCTCKFESEILKI